MQIQIPFCGFYESIANQMIENEIEQAFDHEGNGCPEIPDDFYTYWGKNNKEVEIAFCKLYVDKFTAYLKEQSGLELILKFDELVSPKFYNYETDRIFCEIDEKNVKKLFDHVNTPALRVMVRERHTSRSGFVSFYCNDYDDRDSVWGKPVTEWDSVQLQTLLMAYMNQEGIEEDTYAIMGDMGNGEMNRVVWNHCAKECLDMVNEYDKRHRA